ncbi:MAG: DUF2190 family protein [Planctomycetaceae bacterium]|jgi:predicted RecA/RadA family phage recombinase|nr:DUF2190 family protein [Planctomycetaceae bacterium]
MKARYQQTGEVISYTPTENTEAGTVVIVGDIVGITRLDIPANESGTISLVGIYEIEKATGAIALGTKVYWDATAKKATATVATNTQIGVAVQAAESADAFVQVRLLG